MCTSDLKYILKNTIPVLRFNFLHDHSKKFMYQVYKLKQLRYLLIGGISEHTKLPWVHNTLFFVFDICQH